MPRLGAADLIANPGGRLAEDDRAGSADHAAAMVGGSPKRMIFPGMNNS